MKLFKKIKNFIKKHKRKDFVIFYPSFFCNYKCPYCVITQYARLQDEYPKNTERHWSEWSKIFNKKFKNGQIDISGGEPFLYNGIVELINSLHKSITIHLTSNLSVIEGKLENLKPIHIHASFHPSMCKIDDFLKRAKYVKEKGMLRSVECVAIPEQLPDLKKYKELFEKELGVHFAVDPCINPDFSYNDEQKELLKSFDIHDRNFGFTYDKNLKKVCSAGKNYFIIVPNGDVFACHEGFYLEKSKIHKKFNNGTRFMLSNLFAPDGGGLSEERNARFVMPRVMRAAICH